jgi:hypothetical protein
VQPDFLVSKAQLVCKDYKAQRVQLAPQVPEARLVCKDFRV